jgi:hypothetical protein
MVTRPGPNNPTLERGAKLAYGRLAPIGPHSKFPYGPSEGSAMLNSLHSPVGAPMWLPAPSGTAIWSVGVSAMLDPVISPAKAPMPSPRS